MKYLKQIIILLVAIVLVIGGVIIAGSITPGTETPETNFVTLDDLYNKIMDNATSSAEHTLAPEESYGVSYHSLQEIWEAIPIINPETIASGTTIMGVAGTYDTSLLIPENVASGVSFGTSSEGTMP